MSELKSFGVTVQVHDPLATASEVQHEYGIELLERDAIAPADAVVLAVAHKSLSWRKVGVASFRCSKTGVAFVIDVKARLDRAKKPDGVELWRL